MGEVRIPPITIIFFMIFPTLGLGFAVAVLASPEPRSWSFFTAVLTSWIFLRVSAWFMYKMRDDVLKLEKVTDATEINAGLLSATSDEEGKTDDQNSENPHTVYHHVHLYKILQGLMRPSLITIRIQHASSISMGIMLSIRLFSTQLFGTHPANLDFGSSIDENIAFVHRFDSLIGLVQGSFASFLTYPAVVGLVARVLTTSPGDSLLLKKPNLYFIWLCESISAIMTLYPSIVTITAIASDIDNFANSNHLRKLMEWFIGYILGITFGVFFSSMVQRIILLISGILNALENPNLDADEAISYVVDKLIVTDGRDAEDEKDIEVTYGFGKPEDYKGRLARCVELISRTMTRICQILFAITTILNGIIMGATWHFDQEVKTSSGIICIFLGVVAFVFAIIGFATSRAY